MAQAVIALGSNLGDRAAHMSKARAFLGSLSESSLVVSAIYETEPVGEASTHMYYNAVCAFQTRLEPMELLEKLKRYEQEYGRDPSAPRWSNRTIDLDIIDFNRETISRQRLQVPHPEYTRRLFVLLPLQELFPEWTDLRSGTPISDMIASAPKIDVFKKGVNW
ncbi:2-amino-4-hydroxy-6-hydroxymethyldihydropteridine diphosphokinase [Balneolales bacterium ANBcel1]|nr:2-amino-4-hydroxy-6-hydroxymethyldihydropteridine diphosphokinase [Balneolales bacterium ANBcel1]